MTSFEHSILACRLQDAAVLKAALDHVRQALTARHDPEVDRIERATLACQMRDAAIVREMASNVMHLGGGQQKFGGAARA